MNSRDAAYDEEEQLRRAIEESKEDTKSLPDDPAPRPAKRSRSESETYVSCRGTHWELGSEADKEFQEQRRRQTPTNLIPIADKYIEEKQLSISASIRHRVQGKSAERNPKAESHVSGTA